MKNIKVDVNTSEDHANGKKLWQDKPIKPVTKQVGEITHFGILENSTDDGKSAVLLVCENDIGPMMFKISGEDFKKLAVKLLAAEKKFGDPKANLN